MCLNCQRGPPFNSPVSIRDEDLPCNHEQFTGSLVSEQYLLLSTNYTYFSTNTDKRKSTRNHHPPSLIKSFQRSYQGRDLPFLESCPSTSLMDLQRDIMLNSAGHFKSITSIRSIESFMVIYSDLCSLCIFLSFHPHTFFDQVEDIIDLEADLVRVLADVLIYRPAAGPLGSGLRFRSRWRSLTDAPSPLLPVTKREKGQRDERSRRRQELVKTD